MAITRDQLRDIRQDLNAAMAAIAAKHGLGRLEATNASFAGDAFTFKLEGLKAGGLSKEAQRYNLYRVSADLPPLHTTILLRDGKKYTIEGMNTTGSKVQIKLLGTDRVYLLDTKAAAIARVVA
jgi:hypothetical protein